MADILTAIEPQEPEWPVNTGVRLNFSKEGFIMRFLVLVCCLFTSSVLVAGDWKQTYLDDSVPSKNASAVLVKSSWKSLAPKSESDMSEATNALADTKADANKSLFQRSPATAYVSLGVKDRLRQEESPSSPTRQRPERLSSSSTARKTGSNSSSTGRPASMESGNHRSLQTSRQPARGTSRVVGYQTQPSVTVRVEGAAGCSGAAAPACVRRPAMNCAGAAAACSNAGLAGRWFPGRRMMLNRRARMSARRAMRAGGC